MRTSIIGFYGLFPLEPSTILEEAVQVCNPERESSFLQVRHCLEPCS
jgi:hypothetical protein